MPGDVNLAFLGSRGRNPSWWRWLQGKVLVGKKGFAGAQKLVGGGSWTSTEGKDIPRGGIACCWQRGFGVPRADSVPLPCSRTSSSA